MTKLLNGLLSLSLSLTLVITGYVSVSYAQDQDQNLKPTDEKLLETAKKNPDLAKTKIQINIGDNNKVIEISGVSESDVIVDKDNTQTKEVLSTTTTGEVSNETTTNSEANTTTNTETTTNNNTEINNENNAEGNSKILNKFEPVKIETKSENVIDPKTDQVNEVSADQNGDSTQTTQSEDVKPEVAEEAPIIVIVPKPVAETEKKEEDTVTEIKPEDEKNEEKEDHQVVEGVLNEPTHEVKPEAEHAVAQQPLSKFSLRGTFGFGKFSNFEDITSKYSLGFAVAYDLNDIYSLEFQYIFSQYEDNFDYDFFTQLNTSGYVFDQHELAIILNYKVLPMNGFDISLRGGFNHTSRSAYNNFTGETNTAQGGSAILGAKADVKIARNLSLVGILDYNVSLRSSGYNEVSSPLFLVGGENFWQMNFGLKYQF